MWHNLIRWGALGTLLAAVAGIAWFVISMAAVGLGPEASAFGVPFLVPVGVTVVLAVVIILARIGYRYEWTGFGEDVRQKTDAQDVRRAKTLWDWLALLIIPVVLAIGGLFFSFSQDARQQETEEQRAQDAALQAYLDEIGELLLDKKLQPGNIDNEARTLARARTLTILERLKPGPRPRESGGSPGPQRTGSDRKGRVLQFLYESNLISKEKVVVDLEGANLRSADLRDIDLRSAALRPADLTGASLRGTILRDADLTETILTDANLLHANLIDADLTRAFLNGADLKGAFLRDAELTETELSGADLGGRLSQDASNAQFLSQEQINQAWEMRRLGFHRPLSILHRGVLESRTLRASLNLNWKIPPLKEDIGQNC